MLILGCSDAELSMGSTSGAIVYGTDDRIEVYEHADDRLRTIAEDAVVALIPVDRIGIGEGDAVTLDSENLGELYGLCPDERHVAQPAAADCTGVLIAPDLVLTAGHCVRDGASCESFAYVFGYLLDGTSPNVEIRTDDVYFCARVVEQSWNRGVVVPDFAFVQLDRQVEGREPAPLSPQEAEPSVGDPLTMVGSTLGIPHKVDAGGSVVAIDANAGTLVSNVDAFPGSSGSPVFDSNGHVLGILLAGDRADLVLDEPDECHRVGVAQDSEATELVELLARPLNLLCASDSSWHPCGSEGMEDSGTGEGNEEAGAANRSSGSSDDAGAAAGCSVGRNRSPLSGGLALMLMALGLRSRRLGNA